ncbi:MAG: NEAT domain-containing protein [Muricomes sp.]
MATKRTKQGRLLLKRGLTFLIAAAMTLNVNMIQAFAAGDAPTEPGTYTVPIESLKSKAPLPAVQNAFAGAFGSSLEMTVDESGNKVVTVNSQHMIIDFSGQYHANIKTIDGATYHSYKTELYSPTFGSPSVTEEVDVPDKISFPLPEPNAEGGYVLTLTVDFMDVFMGGGNPYPTTVTLKLDFTNAVAHTTELSNLIASYRQLREVDYTPSTWSALQTVLAQAETMAANGASMADINAMIAQLESAKNNLEWKSGNYSKVNDALAKIPADSSLYTEESWNALMTAKNAVQQGLTPDRQAEIDGWAAEIESKVTALVYKDADYTKVDQAISGAPKDLSKYTDESVKALQKALDGVVRGLKINEQAKVDKMASDINAAVKGLAEKNTSGNTGGNPDKDNSAGKDTSGNGGKAADDVLDKDNLADGIYKVPVQLWHATNNNPSMAAASLKESARITVKNGVYTMYLYTQPMTFGSITASLQELKIADLNGNYTAANAESRDASGNPTSFSFGLPHTQEYIVVKVNPHVEMMGNQDLDARIRVDYASLEKESDNPDDTSVDLTGSDIKGAGKGAGSSTPKTGDSSDALMYSLMSLAFAGIILSTMFVKKRRENAHE